MKLSLWYTDKERAEGGQGRLRRAGKGQGGVKEG